MDTSNPYLLDKDTIAAVATPPGRGGIGILRVSGKQSLDITRHITGITPDPRHVYFCRFKDDDGVVIDEGLALYFCAPHSFTGEDVVEFHTHGSPVVLDILLGRCVSLGARLANAGEFSERAFLNGRMDLIQAEAVSDLINAATAHAARSAVRSLQGVFSQQINTLIDDLIKLRVYVEACIDFPDEDIDALEDKKISSALVVLLAGIDALKAKAKQGIIIKDGLTVVIAGKPNAGKSSLLNVLTGTESAIVSKIPGTTRDILRADIQIEGMPVHIIDTAGLHETSDEIEQEGIRRARAEINTADLILLVVDSAEEPLAAPAHNYLDLNMLDDKRPVILIKNKADISNCPIGTDETSITLSAKTGAGVNFLLDKIKKLMGNDPSLEHGFTARKRHLEKISHANTFLLCAQNNLLAKQGRELLAEDLRQAQAALSEITGIFSSEDLLGEIFSSFCIGK